MICLIAGVISINSHAHPSTAFFYGKPVPVDLLSQFDQVVLEPENIDDITPLTVKGTQVFAYLSVGEINSSRAWLKEIPEQWLLGKNPGWGSRIVDVSLKEWHDYLIEKQMAPLWERGFRGFFLDTLDSYQLVIEDSNQRLIRQQSMVSLIKAMYQRFPGIKLILNRGFDLMPNVANYISAVAAESLFQGWNTRLNNYNAVVEEDRDWLLNKLNQVHEQYGLQVIVIDYVSPKQRKLAGKVADQISELGFTPWVSNVSMDMLGVGDKEISPKRFLVIYDGQDHPDALQDSPMPKFITGILEYLGYTFDYRDARQGLPNYCLAGQYTKIVAWFNPEKWNQSLEYKAWLKRQDDNGLDVIQIAD